MSSTPDDNLDEFKNRELPKGVTPTVATHFGRFAKRAFDAWCALWFWPADRLAASGHL